MTQLSDPQVKTAADSVLAFAHFLEENLGIPIALCSIDGEHQKNPADQLPALMTCHDLSRAAESAERRGYALFSCDERHTAVAIKVPGVLSTQLLAIGVVPTKQTSMLERLVTVTMKLASHQSHLQKKSDELNSCLEQITYDMEEQTWLRTLADQMRLCDVRITVESLAKEVLTSMKGLICAESVALFQSRGVPDEQSMTWIGPQYVNEPSWRRWLWSNASVESCPRARIANGGRVEPHFRASGVNSIIAVPLMVSNRLRGWLVAVNRMETEAGISLHYQCGQREFGTVEASLMSAAATMIGTHSHNVDLLQQQESLVLGVIQSMSSAIDARDPYTRGHSDRVGWYARLIAEKLELPRQQRERIYICGLLHDIGKIGVPDDVLLKPGKLTDEEFDLIKQHPQIGYDIVRNLQQFQDLLPGILHHHESLDGAGYPHGLVGESIPLQARILAVADAFDAMSSSRPYRQGMSEQKAISILRERSGIQWDAAIVRAFLQIPERLRQGHAEVSTEFRTGTNLLNQERITPDTVNADVEALLSEL